VGAAADQELQTVRRPEHERRGREGVGLYTGRGHHRGREDTCGGPTRPRVEDVPRTLVPTRRRERAVADAKGPPRLRVGVDRVAHVDRDLAAEDREAAAPQVDEAGGGACGPQDGEGLVGGVALGDPAEVQAGAGLEGHAAGSPVEAHSAEADLRPEPSTLRVRERAARTAVAARGPHQRLHGRVEGARRRGRHVEGMGEHRAQVGRGLGVAGVVEAGQLTLPVEGETRLDPVEGREGVEERPRWIGRAFDHDLGRRSHRQPHLPARALPSRAEGHESEEYAQARGHDAPTCSYLK